MARRSQPYRLTGPLTQRRLEEIDEMFQLLFDDTHNGTMDIRAAQIRSGILSVPRGGTGLGEYVIGDLLYASDTDELSTLASVAAGSYLRSGGVTTAPVWSSITIPNTAVVGDLWYASTTGAISALASVAAGSYLRSGGVSTAPVWSSVTLPNSAAVGDLWYASTTGAMTALADVAVGSYLRSGGVNTAPLWSTTTLPNTATTGDLWYASASNVMTALADVSAGSYLRSGGVSTAPVWSTVKIPNTATTGDLWYGSSTNTLSALADVAVGSYLRSGGVGTAPLWSTTTIPNTATTGDLWYASATNVISALAGVAVGSYLRSGGVGTAPLWSTVTLPNTAVVGDLWYASATNVLSALADVAVGSYLRSGGVATAPVWSTVTLPNTAAQGDVWYSNASNAIVALAKSTTATRYLANTGTSNNPAWAQVDLTNGITGALPVSHLSNGVSTTISSTATGTQNNWAPGLSGDTYVTWNGGSSLTVTGLTPVTGGTRFTFKNVSSAQWAFFEHEGSGSTSTNRFRNFATGGATPIGPGGAITYQYKNTDDRWYVVSSFQGSWFTPTFAAGDFTGNASMTWTVDSGDVQTDRYMLFGATALYQYSYNTTTVGGTPSTDLRRAIPALLTPKTSSEVTATWSRNLDNLTANDGFCYTLGSSGLHLFFRRDKTSGVWAASTNQTYVQGTHIWELV